MDSDADYSLDHEEIEDDHLPTRKRGGSNAHLAQKLKLGGTLDVSSSEQLDDEAEESPLDDGYTESSPRKRPAGGAADLYRPFKRQKGVFNNDYLNLLNREIEDAAQRICVEDDLDLAPTQLGLTFWSPSEKRLFFEAVARLGKHDLPVIAARVGSKSVIEVKHYLDFLQEALGLRRKTDHRSTLVLAEVPAAIEISQQCCHAQEEAADAVSVRQERREQQREEDKWGSGWDVTPTVARELVDGQEAAAGKNSPFGQLFHLQRWLQLSQRIFMNSSVPGDNWNFIDDNPPSVWATTFEDFYSLALSITRRLVQTTLFISMSRIRAKSELAPGTRGIVRRNDVEAAIASLGLPANSREFWLQSARRLRLSVYEEPPDCDEESDEEALTYEEVEHMLSEGQGIKSTPEPADTLLKLEPLSEDDEYESNSSDAKAPVSSIDKEEDEIAEEATEVLKYSAADFPETSRTKQALKSRIMMERQQEQHAERCDEHASYVAETEMWDLLQKRPPMELPKKHDPGQPSRSNKDVESIYPIGRDWSNRVEYYSEWETVEASPLEPS